MFYGEYEHSLDKKGRLIIPSRFREVCKENYVEKFFLTRGLDGCLFMFSENEWNAQESKFKVLSFTKAEARKFNRIYFSGACEIIIDTQGRMLIPKYLKDFANIRKDIVIIGVSNRIEIWAREKWEEFYKGSKDRFEEIAEGLVDT
ncbi:MAG: cell division/cell wall cluster transcriptional repressor MraZ [Candidatus Omnitrophica bacterium CG07_land_8_20_14_0_80_42_15]|uniref:Transcriptional regulator MraZ n=1 Tax=Candidatus Aquitaenariimonas noxiae TaxID=1974741 RepID=A0A2J0KWC4_9BACT|nr:MAG: cell division/cell wall cluster transcriptional repressor MraZ [Candidatus Omnitrophica bacterium CG07_land_8_20_14_0_80_42_15]